MAEAPLQKLADRELLLLDPLLKPRDLFALLRNGSCLLDDQPRRLYRTDVCFMSTPVPPGRHTIQLSYETPRLYAGAAVAISLLAAAYPALWAGAREPIEALRDE
jgi:hypothetical protein